MNVYNVITLSVEAVYNKVINVLYLVIKTVICVLVMVNARSVKMDLLKKMENALLMLFP